MKPFLTSSNLRAFSFLAVHLLLLPPTHAILDQNSNNLSDLWEKQHNSGNLLPNTFLTTADSDQDGWDNLTESFAGTDPFSSTSPNGFVTTELIRSLTYGAYTLEWSTKIGKVYQVQYSQNLTNWSNLGAPIIATTASHSIGINATQTDTTTPPKLFWRVTITDIDSDGDGLTNAEEEVLGTNPNKADTDYDGLTDFKESELETNPLLADSDNDGSNDGEEIANLTDPKSNQSHPAVWRSVKSKLVYNFFDYPVANGGRHGYISAKKLWNNSATYTNSLTSEIAWPNLGTQLATYAVFPDTMPASAGAVIASEGSATLLLDSPCYHADLIHQRIWLSVQPALPYPVTRDAIIVTERNINGIEAEKIAQVVTVTIPAGSITSDPIELNPEFESNPTTVAEGAYENMAMLFLPLDLVDKNKHVISKLKVGKMSDTGVLSGTASNAILDIDKDPDRFFVRVLGGSSMGGISVKVSTTDNPIPIYNDDATEIALIIDDNNDAITKSMLMVSDVIDDNFQVDSSVDNTFGDRTHLVQLDGNFRIEEIKIGTSDWLAVDTVVPVPKEKTVQLQIIRMSDSNVTQADTEEDIKTANERYAQVGIKLVVASNLEKQVPSSMSSTAINADITSGPFQSPIGPDAKSLISLFGTIAIDDIHVFYCQAVISGAEDIAGYAFIEDFLTGANEKYANNLLISGGRKIFTLAHELGHVLTNRGHFGNEYANSAYQVDHNIMKRGTSVLNEILGTKRFYPEQQTWINTHNNVK